MRDEISNNYDTIDEKRRLLLSIAYGKEPVSDDVISIISEMAETSVNKDGAILSAFDQLYALKIRSDVEELLNKLLVIFKANRFLEDYSSFFKSFHLCFEKIRADQEKALHSFLRYFFSAGIPELWFSFCLFQNVLDISSLGDTQEIRNLPINRMCLILKGIIYFLLSIDKEDRALELARQFALAIEDANDDGEHLIEFFMQEFYSNYPVSSQRFWESCVTRGKWDTELKKRVVTAGQNTLHLQQKRNELVDFRPSRERGYIYQSVRQQLNEKIRKDSMENSVLSLFCSQRVMKYGSRNAYFREWADDSYTLDVMPYSTIQYSIELPKMYLKTPLDFALSRERFLEERNNACVWK